MKTREKKYLKVKNYILDKIRKGELYPGNKIPTEDEIMEITGFSRSTVRRAVSELEQEGYLYKIHGSGSFVRKTTISNSFNIYAFLYKSSKGIEKDIIYGMKQAINNSTNNNFNLILKREGENTREMIETIQSIISSTPSGLIIIPQVSKIRSNNRLLAATLRKMENSNFTVIQIDRVVPEYEGNYIMTDHYKGAYEMTQFIIEKGHKKITVLYEHPENSSIRLRLKGVESCLRDHDLSAEELNKLEVPLADFQRRSSEILESILNNNSTCVFCFESEIALETYKLFMEKNINVPDDISLCSFDDHSFYGIREDFITAVVQPLEEIGYLSVDLIRAKFENRLKNPIRLLIQPHLVIRRSVAEI